MFENTREKEITKNPEKIQEEAPSFAFSIANREPWEQDSDAEIEWVTGLWQGIKEV